MIESPLDDFSELKENNPKNAYLNSILEWWESQRLKYNLVTFGIGAGFCLLLSSKLATREMIIMLAIWAILIMLANVFYSIGWLLEGAMFNWFGYKLTFWARVTTWIFVLMATVCVFSIVGVLSIHKVYVK